MNQVTPSGWEPLVLWSPILTGPAAGCRGEGSPEGPARHMQGTAHRGCKEQIPGRPLQGPTRMTVLPHRYVAASSRPSAQRAGRRGGERQHGAPASAGVHSCRHSHYPRDAGSPLKPLALPAAAAGAQEVGESGNWLDSHVCSKQERGGRDGEQKACYRETGTVPITPSQNALDDPVRKARHSPSHRWRDWGWQRSPSHQAAQTLPTARCPHLTYQLVWGKVIYKLGFYKPL